MQATLEQKIEAVLFWKGEPVAMRQLASLLDEDEATVAAAVERLETNLALRGLVIVRQGNEVMIGTTPVIGPLIEKLSKEELKKDIGKAGLEVLAIVLYRAPVSRAEVEWVRGVNSSFTIRHLMIRGLIERNTGAGTRGFLYYPTINLLQHLGITKKESLPDYEATRKEIEDFLKNTRREDVA